MKTSDELRLARIKLGYSQQNMADELGMSQPNYSKLENGIYENISPQIRKRIESIVKLEKTEKPLTRYEEKITNLEGQIYFLKKELDILKGLMFKIIKHKGKE